MMTDKEVQGVLAYLTCECGARMVLTTERRPLNSPLHPRETFQDIEVLTCGCGKTKERCTAIGH